MQLDRAMMRIRSSAVLVIVSGTVFGLACEGSGASQRASQRTAEDVPAERTPPAATTAPAASDGGPPDDGSTPVVPYQPFDVNHVLSTGQSNSVAHEGRPVLSTTQPFANLMFDVGVMTSGDCEREGCRTYQKPSSFVPLVEGDTFWYPVETMSAGMANLGAKLAGDKQKPRHDMLVSLAGRNGLTYWCLRKGSCNFIDPTYLNAFDESMKQVDDAMAIAEAAGKSYVVRAVTAVHGESDDYAYATNTQEFPLDGTDGAYRSLSSYADALLEWQRDYESGVRARTGQTLPVPLLVSQHSGWNDIPTSAVAQYQYDAHVRSKGKVVLVTAGYPLDWHYDCRHYSNHGERQLGEYFAKAYAQIVFAGLPWEPVHPREVTLSGSPTIIRAKFHVPKPPLVLDTDRVTNPGDYGFEVVDVAGMRLKIASVAITAPDTVTVTLASAPAGPVRLRYAYTGTPHTCPGRTQGARGNLRDSDDTPSLHGYELFNWAVHFEVPVAPL